MMTLAAGASAAHAQGLPPPAAGLAAIMSPASAAPAGGGLAVPAATGKAAASSTPDIGSAHTLDGMKSTLRFCAGNPDAQGRLSCYEDLSRQNGIHVLPASGTYGAEGSAAASFKWATKLDTSSAGPKTAVAALATGDVTSADVVDPGEKAVLYMRCTDKKMAFYVTFDKPVSPDPVEVQISTTRNLIDARMYTWLPSKSNNAVGLWNDAQARVMASFVAGESTLNVRVNQPAGRFIDAFFNLAGVRQAVSDVRSSCGW